MIGGSSTGFSFLSSASLFSFQPLCQSLAGFVCFVSDSFKPLTFALILTSRLSCRFHMFLSLIQAINYCFPGSNHARVLQVLFVWSIHQLEQYLTFQIMPVWHDLKCKILTLRVLQVWSLLQFYQLDFDILLFRWLMSQGEGEKAVKIMKRIARLNGKKVMNQSTKKSISHIPN